MKIPKKYQGIVLAGELVHPRGFSFVGPIMNSKPSRAVELQHLTGKLKFMPHNILNRAMPYGKKVAFMRDMVKAMNSPHIKLPRYSSHPSKLFESIKAKGGEGIVLFDPRSESPVMYKKKLWDQYTGEVVDIVEGTGKFKNSMGALIVRDKHGNLVRIGAGSGMDTNLRKEIWNNFDTYKGRRVRVVAQGSTGKSLRQPRFAGWDLSERPLDSFETGETLYSQYMANVLNNSV
jgi:hypothetical protein